jgi:methyl-accepting chemotaxis protein
VAKITSSITSIDKVERIVEDDPKNVKRRLGLSMPETETSRNVFTAPTHSTVDISTSAPFPPLKLFFGAALLLWIGVAALISVFSLNVLAKDQSLNGFEWAGIATMFLLPTLIIFAGYSLAKKLHTLNQHAHTLAQAADNLMQPDDALVGKTKIMADAIKQQIKDVNLKVSTSLAGVEAMEEIIAAQTDKLSRSNTDATRTAAHIAESIKKQYAALDTISGTFDQRMGSLADTLNSHTDALASATQLAEQKIKEARMSIENAAERINSASDNVKTNTVEAAENLNTSHEDIKSIADILHTRSEELNNIYASHAGALKVMIETLRDEQESLGASLEARLEKMRDLSLSAQASAEGLSDASRAGKETVEALAQSASLADNAVKIRFQEMQDMVRYSSEHASSISDKALRRVRHSLELTRKEISRIEQDMAALQDRMSQTTARSLELIEDDSPPSHEDEGQTPHPKGTAKRTRLKLKPLLDDIPHVAEKTAEIQDEATDKETEETVDLQEHEIAFDDDDARYDEDSGDENLQIPEFEDEKTQSETKISQKTEKNIAKGLRGSTAFDDIDALSQYKEEFTEQPQNLVGTEDNYDINDDTMIDMRPGAPDAEIASEDKPRFSLRSLLGRAPKGDENASLSIATLFEGEPLSLDENIIKIDILEDLANLDLPPNAVVDDGCIIEAAATRVQDGHVSMSRYVAKHLHSPVQHLAVLLSRDEELSMRVISFTAKFDQSVEELSGRRAAIRSKLEGEYGRAYLLCDAALNYGRV